LFESLVVFENVPMETTLRQQLGAKAGLVIEEVDYRPQTNYPLTLLAAGGDAVTFELLYDTARLGAVTAARLLRHLAELLANLPGAAESCVAGLPLLSEAERQQIVVEWNDTTVPPVESCTVHGLIEAQAARTPEARALGDLGGGELTYRDLVARSRGLASFLERRGIGPETLVACCLERTAELPAVLLGVLAAGAAYVPLDADYPRERLAQVMEDAGAGLLLTHESLRDRLPAHRLPEVVLERERPEIRAEKGGGADRQVAAAALAYVIYTSGSTGRPKGVQISHGAVANFLLDMRRRLDVRPGDNLLAITSLGFDIAGLELFLPLLCGARVVVAGPDVARDAGHLSVAGRGQLGASIGLAIALRR
jgi:non-ribosomal peptide synthetase component F